MKVLRFDSVGGASGDMILAALVDLGINAGTLQNLLSGIVGQPLEIRAERSFDRGLSGIRISIRAQGVSHADHHVGLDHIRRLLSQSSLPERVQALSLKVFERLAKAEASVHQTTPEAVHFHELGAVDTIADIVGACLGLDMLEVDEVIVGPLPLGVGTIECEHGILPNPAPATVELLRGHPVVNTQEPFELVTPTGAALLMEWRELKAATTAKHSAPACGALTIGRSGHGLGHRSLQTRPNILRATLMETKPSSVTAGDHCIVLECNLDDTIPELIGSLSQKLLAAGAWDAFTVAAQMKKQRPGTLLCVLCDPSKREQLIDLIFTESTTFGIREYSTYRHVLERRFETVSTPYGEVRVKLGLWKGRVVTRAPEHEDCVACAERHGVAVRTVYEAALRAG